ncbi:Nucleoside triphosphate pyrophosphohydrolase [Pseudodesulfovibrio profundus]|uniref:Nucleoside triphosphate pyrophosphohydrolase n=1 Tax=Pseudodesulfovibrio profundus TaxID=57320 RepID=A0A2C8F771_9BACT|nr:nucleoside triphosphate pyrophosphohydrolase [Pseudodesulfovibrio profundus]SOB57970.1 Nucleoside triphosphate pyrophosphohydrolase [Pseudodesulfovibrio profundus]
MSDKPFDAHSSAMEELLEVIEALLGPDGCPWDKEQTPESMCDYLAEESFELIEAIRAKDTQEAQEELGDVLFILLFMGVLFEKDGKFSLGDALKSSAAKMIRRHPHVFSDKQFDNQQALLDNWEATKKVENKETGKKGVFDSLPKGLPPLLKAYRINSKAARNGFTWDSTEGVQEQLTEEWNEWQDALQQGDSEASEKEFGDYLFTLVELGRRHGIKANSALDYTNQKFLRRFAAMESLARKQGTDLDSMNLEQMNELWDQVKHNN